MVHAKGAVFAGIGELDLGGGHFKYQRFGVSLLPLPPSDALGYLKAPIATLYVSREFLAAWYDVSALHFTECTGIDHPKGMLLGS